MAENKILLEIKDLHASVGDKEILRGIDLTVREGETHAIMGPNGSGKSTLSAVLAGRDSYTVTAGEVTFNGRDILDLPTSTSCAPPSTSTAGTRASSP